MRFAVQTGFLFVALAVCLQAQHGGGAGGHAASRGGSSLHSFSSGFRPSTGFTGAPATGFNSVYRGGNLNRRPSNPRFGRNYAPNRRGYVPFIYGAYFDPFYSSFDSAFDYGPGSYAYPPDSGEQTAEVTANLLGEQMQRLSDQVQQLGSQQSNVPPPYAPGYSPAAPPSDPAPTPITVVLRNGQQIQVQNYAVMGDSFWDFSRQPARRIPLTSVDIAASTKVTEANGGQFPAI
ncbi:MAG TPA: hypothetical protein VGG97_29100 [Bryobacteraceae bacterium]|jgi:hypothetical protein